MPDNADDELPAASPVVSAEPAELELSRRAAAGRRVARSLEFTGRGMRLLIFVIASIAALVGAIAMVVGVLSWRHAEVWRLPLGVIIVILLCLPAVALPFMVHRRLAPITRAIEHPDALYRQAVDYVGDVRSGTELSDLAAITTGPTKIWRVRSLLGATRLVAAFTSRVTPDAKRHPMLAAFMPVYLKTLWLVLLVTLWALFAAIVVLGVSLIAVVAGLTPS